MRSTKKMYLFVNYTSGGNRGKSFINLNAELITFHLDEASIELRIYALNNDESR
jgi:hypothetical protein